MRLAPFACLGSMFAFLDAGAASAQRAAKGASFAPPTILAPVEEASRFTVGAALIDFEALSPGTPVAGVPNVPLVLFELAGQGLPVAWNDPLPRVGAPAVARKAMALGAPAIPDRAIRGAQPFPNAWTGPLSETPAVPPVLPLEPALRMRFASAQSRVGFEFRALDPLSLTLVVTCIDHGIPFGTLYVSVQSRFGFVGVESARPFDQLRIDFVNPDAGEFSLDNLRFEPDTADADGDGVPDFIDVCETVFDPLQEDQDGDGIGDACDRYPLDPANDGDGDGIPAPLDNCPDVKNPLQEDADGDGIGDACDPLPLQLDSDGDGVPDESDNCPTSYNPGQEDCDGDLIGDVCDPTLVSPPAVNLTLSRGQSAVVSSSVCLPPLPPLVDLLVAIDTTGSMSAEIANVRAGIIDFVKRMRATTNTGLRFAVVSFKDYPNTYASCGYSDEYGLPQDKPFVVEAPFGLEDDDIILVLSQLTASGGRDLPEAYARVLWEVSQPSSGIGFRPGALRVIALVIDDVPHDCDLRAGLVSCPSIPLTTGIDPGRDELLFTADDIDFQDLALAPLVADGTRVGTLYSNPTRGICAWGQWSAQTRGTVIKLDPDGTIPDGTNVTWTFLDIVGQGHVEKVEFVVSPGCPLEIDFDPAGYFQKIDISGGASVPVLEAIKVPVDLDPSITQVSCSIEFLADGALVATQTIDVTVP